MNISSKIYVFGIVDSNNINSISLPCGFESNSIYCIPLHDIGIVVCDFSGKISDVKNGVLVHEKIIELLMNSYTVLPMRFQTAFSCYEKTVSELSKLYNDFKDNLARLSHKFEFGIKVLWPADKIQENLLKDNKETETKAILGVSPAKDYLKKRYKNYKINEILKPGQQLVFNKNSLSIAIKSFDENYELAWKNDQLIFHLMPFEDVITALEKWFDVNIDCNPSQFKSETLTVRFEEYESLETILQVIAKANGFKYTIEDKVVKIRK